MDQSIVFFLAAIIIVGALLFALTCVKKRGKKFLNVEYYRAKCLEIEHQLKPDQPSSFHLSVINADKLLDQVLRERGMQGKTMGERMKSAVNMFSDRSGIWMAHKLRNKIVHEPDVRVTYVEAKDALRSFRKALKDLGAI